MVRVYDTKQPQVGESAGDEKWKPEVEKSDEKRTATAAYSTHLTLIKAVRRGGVPITLNIEISAPKVVFNDNFNEITENDFDYLCLQLKRKLYNIGVLLPMIITKTKFGTTKE